jgi:23S rRNA (uracil1939-C5)-methyltransferase
VELTIDELAAGGDGVGRTDDGRVVFVPFTAPGDRVRVRIEREYSRHARAHVEELLEAGPQRTDPPCPVFGSCGGCSWQHIEYAAQLEAKARIVADAFARIAGTQAPRPVGITPSPAEYGYRSRARVLVEGGRVGFRRRRSHAVCATRRCPILAPPLQQQLAELAEAPPVEDGEWEFLYADGAARAGPLPAAEGHRMDLVVAGERVGISPGVFAQSNSLLFDALAGAVLKAAGDGELAFDLFAGSGFFTLALARRYSRIVALESDPAAVGDLEANLQRAGLTNVVIEPMPLEDAVERDRFRGLLPEVVVVDPPRSGLPPGSADALVDIGPRRIVYLSCDPATQARDAATLFACGYSLDSLEAFDLFPQTPHVESLAVFTNEGLGERRIRVR